MVHMSHHEIHEHKYKQYSADEVACVACGHEPHQRPEACHRTAKTVTVRDEG